MKKCRKIRIVGFLFVVIGGLLSLSACNNEQTPTTAEELFKTNPVTVNWSEKSSDIESFAADVSVYTMNSRKDSYLSKTDGYRLSYKIINGIAYSRVDLDSEFSGGVSRAVITDGSEMVVYNNDSSEVEYRLPVNEEEKNEIDFLDASPITGRVSLDKVRAGAQRLSLDMTEDSEAGSLIIKIPSSYYPAANGETRLSTKVTFDLATEALDEVEIVTIDDENVTTTTTVTNVYEESGDEIIKVGSVTVIDTENPNKIEGFAEDYETYDSLDDIPEISEAEFEELNEQGLINETEGIEFGDPSDLSSTETIVELYSTVDLNGVDNEAFRFLLGEE